MCLISDKSARLFQQKLQHVQNVAARIICTVKRFDHITPSLFNRHWLLIRHRILFKILLLCYKALNGQAPDYITELLKHKIPSRYALRTKNDRFLLQRTTLRTLSTLGDRSFTIAEPELWNSLPSFYPSPHRKGCSHYITHAVFNSVHIY